MLTRLIRKSFKNLDKWARKSIGGLFLFNLIFLLLVLLRFAGYFSPFLAININLIYLISLVLSVILLRANSEVLFLVAIGFWFFGSFLKMAHVDIWADRTIEYFFQAVSAGFFMLVYESLVKKTSK